MRTNAGTSSWQKVYLLGCYQLFRCRFLKVSQAFSHSSYSKMLFSSIITVAGLAVGTQARYFKRDDGITISSRYPVAKRAPGEIVATSATIPLKKIQAKGSTTQRSSLSSFITVPNGTTTALTALENGQEFAAEVTVGTTTLDLIIDTGSSDTWAVQSGFTCTDFQTGKTTSESACNFGPFYTKSSAFKSISGETFSIEYGDLETLNGVFGTEYVTVAGITVDQQIAVVTKAKWLGDGTTSGLMGLSYPAM